MSISIVITTCNRAPLLESTLDRLRLQAYEPGDEVIVVDNGSRDATPDVLSRAARGFPVPFRALREPTPGKSPALNTGIAAARGEVLALTDDDVLVDEDWLATIRGLFRDPSLALVGGRVDPRWERPAPAWLRLDEQGIYGMMASPLALLHYGEAQPLGGRTAVGANLAVRRSVVHALGGFAPHLGRRTGTLLCGEDHDFCQRAVAAGYVCVYRPELRARHWVPAERTRLAYYLRWFFWSGVTHAMLEREAGDGGARCRSVLGVPRYLWKQLMASPVRAAVSLVAGRRLEAASRIVEGAFAAGYVSRRFRDLLERRDVPSAHAPAAHVETMATER